MSTTGIGALLGLMSGLGIVMMLAWWQDRRPATVGRRIAPYVTAGRTRAPQFGAPGTGIEAWSTMVALVLPRRETSHRRRLAALRSGDRVSGVVGWGVVGWGVVGSLSGIAMAGLLQHGEPTLTGAALLALVGAAAGVLARGRHRARQARRRRDRISEQLPTVAELLAFTVAAGQSPLAALDRVARTLSCELADEIGDVVACIRAGDSIDSALRAMAARIGVANVSRFVEGMLVAIERGTPLAETLRAQAADARADERRRLLEVAGRKDVAMLVPVVFLILPTVVLVALFPGITALRLVVA